jgi:hypothetical protein
MGVRWPPYVLQFQAIDKLEALGINKLDIKKCKDSGYHTADALLMNTAKVLLVCVFLDGYTRSLELKSISSTVRL